MKQEIIHRKWSLYNLAQTSEKLLAMRLISEAVDFLQIPYEYAGNGRPGIGLGDMAKVCCIKVFNNFSCRRTMCELRLAHALGYIREIPHFNSISNYMKDERMVPWLHKLYKILATPLAGIESNFAVDATGFSNMRKSSWVDYRAGRISIKGWKKVHIISGISTMAIASAKVTEGRKNDMRYFEGLVREAAGQFRILEVYGDSGYLSRFNCDVVEEVGGQAYIKPRSNTSLSCRRGLSRPHAWKAMLNLWRDNRELFLQHYHRRSNVESAFSAMKRKFLPYTRSRTDIAQENEILCKVVCHNASVLCNSIFELKVNIRFGEKE